jgi:hypothetical protein
VPRLGSVLGSILAELTRARAVADELTKELVTQYEADPVLSSLSVPRVALSEAEISIRFIVDEVDEGPEVPADPAAIRDEWARHFTASVLPGVIKPIPLEEDERLAILEAFGGGERNLPSVRLPIREVRSALTGDEMILAEATTVKALERFDTLTPAIKRKLGGKTSFQRALADASRVSLEAFMKDRIRSDLIKAALASKLQVAIEAGSLANRPDEVQEIKLIIRGEDLSSIVEREQEV